MKCNTASQFRPFCDCCERDNMSDWIEGRQRYECDACQRDHECHCDVCGDPTTNAEDDYGEYVCDDCLQNRAERAWERHCEAFHDGGSSWPRSLQEQQAEAKRLK